MWLRLHGLLRGVLSFDTATGSILCSNNGQDSEHPHVSACHNDLAGTGWDPNPDARRLGFAWIFHLL